MPQKAKVLKGNRFLNEGDEVKLVESKGEVIRGEKTPSMVQVSKVGMPGAVYIEENELELI